MRHSGEFVHRSVRVTVVAVLALAAVACTPPSTTTTTTTTTSSTSTSTTSTTSTTTTTVPTALPSTVTVADNATTVPGGPAPVEYGGTIVFTATVTGTGATPGGSIHWLVRPSYVPAGDTPPAGVVSCGDTPLVDGVATCSVTPGQYYDPGNDVYLDYIYPVDAIAVYVPDASGVYDASSGSDSTDKLTVPGFVPAPQTPFIVVSGPVDLHMQASDALGRPLTYTWSCPAGVDCSGITGPDFTTPSFSGIATYTVVSICPAGIANPDSSFECARAIPSITLKGEPQTI